MIDHRKMLMNYDELYPLKICDPNKLLSFKFSQVEEIVQNSRGMYKPPRKVQNIHKTKLSINNLMSSL